MGTTQAKEANHDFRSAEGPTHIPAMTGMHDGGVVLARGAQMREAFAEMLLHPAAEAVLRNSAQIALSNLHRGNVDLFGWRDAEVLRAEAFSWAVANTIPVPEAIESDFGAEGL